MGFVSLSCPNCGAKLNVEENAKEYYCPYCDRKFKYEEERSFVNNNYTINSDSVNLIYQEKDFEIVGGILRGYKGESVNVMIPDSVKGIANNCFNGSFIESVVMSDSVKEIGQMAFANCRYLMDITLSKNLTVIGDGAFMNCSSLEKVDIDCPIPFVPMNLFNNCTSLKEVRFPDNISDISESAFKDCRSLVSIFIPNSVKTIYKTAFYNCTSLNEIVIEGNREDRLVIGESAFENCTSLNKVKVSNIHFTVYDRVFKNCNNMKIFGRYYYKIMAPDAFDGTIYEEEMRKVYNDKQKRIKHEETVKQIKDGAVSAGIKVGLIAFFVLYVVGYLLLRNKIFFHTVNHYIIKFILISLFKIVPLGIGLFFVYDKNIKIVLPKMIPMMITVLLDALFVLILGQPSSWVFFLAAIVYYVIMTIFHLKTS